MSKSLRVRAASALGASAVLAILALGPAGPAHAETWVVQMTSVDFHPQFVPADLTILPGDTVRWINVDPSLLDHSTCSGTGTSDPAMGDLWNSGAVSTDGIFEITFDRFGEYEYFSVLHEFEGMFGIIRVTDGSTPVDEGIEESTWSQIKQRFAGILPKE